MHTTPDNDIKSELSYAYLHAVASMIGASVKEANRLDDNKGIDATITYRGPFDEQAIHPEIDLKIQLKATSQALTDLGTHLSFTLPKKNQYDDLRDTRLMTPRILVVMVLPEDKAEWLSESETELAIKKCAYWVSLRNAEESASASKTVYLPKTQLFTPNAFQGICDKLAQGNHLNYAAP